ncbi:MAG: PHP domain-containing protein, partial [Clostridiales bacterium]
MKYYDYHIHSHISFDGTAHMTEMCREALQRNISGLMFTEHWELGFEDFGIYLSLADYQKAIAEARKA